ncbi:MAG: alpha/beta fold hydrolase [Candidatus Nanoarchaeia archaeon]|nr:alpha/beta fold hydrolase [Candidatus Nanoarchaeia archaeon]
MLDNLPRKLKPLILLLGVLILVFVLVIILVKISFLAGFDLNLFLEPGDLSLDVKDREAVEVNFTLKTSNLYKCVAECSYEFEDLSRGKSIDSDTIMLKPKEELSRKYILESPEIGSGQRIYNFKVSCKNIKSLFCQTSGATVLKNSIITLNYDLTEEEQVIKPNVKIELESYLTKLRKADLNLNEIKGIKEKIYSDEITITKVEEDFSGLNLEINNLVYLWGIEHYTNLYESLNESYELRLETLDNELTEINKSLGEILILNNNIVDFLDEVLSYNSTLGKTLNESYFFVDELNLFIDEFNNDNFTNYSSLYDEMDLLKNKYLELNLSYIEEDYYVNITEPKKSKIDILNLTIESDIEIVLSDNPPICCIFGDCNPCCTDEICKDDPSNFPIIFLHGHAFNKKNSPESSLNSFSEIQSNLEEEGYINAGIVSPYLEYSKFKEGEWGLSGRPITVRATYYYEVLDNNGTYTLIPRKSDDITIYAKRLNDIVELVKYRTGKSKVNIVAHSMGGLVSREYIRLYGEDSVNNLVLIGTPNQGIIPKIYTFCRVLGEDKECDQMKEGSDFLDILNSFKLSNVSAYTISGRGCDMKWQDGDGIVTYKDSLLEDSKNFEVIGECSDLLGMDLHSDLLDPEKHPETYTYLKKILNE